MLQKQIFTKILQSHNNQAEALQAVSELLFLNKSNVYRRFSGDIALKPQEIEMLAKHYDFSLDELIYHGSQHYIGNYIKNENQNTIVGYLTYVIRLCEFGLSRLEYDYTFYLNTADFLISHYRSFPELFYFKMVQWNRLLWTKNTSFRYNPYQMTTQELKLFDTYCRLYSELNHVEIFDVQNVTIILEQLIYTYETGVMTREDVELFISQYYQFLDELEEKVVTGNLNLKQPNNSYKVYFNSIPNNTLLGLGSNTQLPYTINIYNSPDIIFSTDIKMANKLKSYFNRTINRARLITGFDELTRRQLFTHYRKQVRQVEKTLLVK